MKKILTIILALVPYFCLSQSNDLESNQKIIKIKTIAGEEFKGQILYVTDSLLVFWKSSELYNTEHTNEFTKVFYSSEIKDIVVERERCILSGMKYGYFAGSTIGMFLGFSILSKNKDAYSVAGLLVIGTMIIWGISSSLVGGIIGAVQGIDNNFSVEGVYENYKIFFPELKKISVFQDKPPNIIQDFIEKNDLFYTKYNAKLNNRKQSNSLKRFHVSFSGIWRETKANDDIVNAFYSSNFGGISGLFILPFPFSKNYPDDNSNLFSYMFSAEYEVFNRFNLGFSVNDIPEQKVLGIANKTILEIPDIEFQYQPVEYAGGKTFNLFVSYVFKKKSPLLIISNLEFSAGIGLNYNKLYVKGKLDNLTSIEPFSFKKNIFGKTLKFDADYYFLKNSSLRFGIEGNFIPSINIPQVSRKIRDFEIKLKPHYVDFSGVNFSVGLRFHF